MLNKLPARRGIRRARAVRGGGTEGRGKVCVRSACCVCVREGDERRDDDAFGRRRRRGGGGGRVDRVRRLRKVRNRGTLLLLYLYCMSRRVYVYIYTRSLKYILLYRAIHVCRDGKRFAYINPCIRSKNIYYNR